ncbi:hypothetical protein pb186bvf_006652 [Paramecium bursaria]
MDFKLDTRNIGGLKVMADHMYNHHKALIDVKPAIKITKPKPHVDSKKTESKKPIDLPMYKNKAEFNNVIKTFQTLNTGRIDTNAPFSMEMRKQITGNLTKKEKFQNQEHLLNLQSQFRRINNTGSMQERKKNQNDPIAHPPKFFRRDGQSLANVRIDKLLEHFTKEHRQINESVDSQLSERIKGIDQQKLYFQERAQSAKQNMKQKQQKRKTQRELNAEKEQKFESISNLLDKVPKVKGDSDEDYEELRKQLILLIFKYRVYRTPDLETLFARALDLNRHLNLIRAEEVFQSIRDTMKG